MVAVIKTGTSLNRILNYNELKVQAGVAKCLVAANYPKDVEQLTFKNKLNRLINLAMLNEKVRRNSVHISLNFDPSENVSESKLQKIATDYMQKIGFGKQPYLVYQHYDVAHPHIHIVSVKVRSDGSRIDMHNMGKNQSEIARKEIETAYGLVKADSKKNHYELKPVQAQKVQYGKSETKRAISVVLDTVLTQYKFTSLPELNSVLNQYNVLAERGNEDSRTYKRNGLLFRILDEEGKKVGVPIKASLFHHKPTLKYLENLFKTNQASKLKHKQRLTNVIELTCAKPSLKSLDNFIEELRKQGIAAVLRRNEKGQVYGITYVDHISKCVFNGSALGKKYSARAIQDRFSPPGLSNQPEIKILANKAAEKTTKEHPSFAKAESYITRLPSEAAQSVGSDTFIKALVGPEDVLDYVPYQLKKRTRRRKRTQSNDLNI